MKSCEDREEVKKVQVHKLFLSSRVPSGLHVYGSTRALGRDVRLSIAAVLRGLAGAVVQLVTVQSAHPKRVLRSDTNLALASITAFEDIDTNKISIAAAAFGPAASRAIRIPEGGALAHRAAIFKGV